MVIVDCLTDNPNRTFGDVRQCFTKSKCKLGSPGSVSHLFDHSAILVFKGSEEEAALEVLMMADVDVSDIESESGKVTVFAPQTEYHKAKQALLDAFEEVDFEVDEIQFVPQTSVLLGEEEQVAFDNLVDMLEYLEDVQNVYHNVG
jgi:transcriptional/translational regulatory protein YebC/TACO1